MYRSPLISPAVLAGAVLLLATLPLGACGHKPAQSPDNSAEGPTGEDTGESTGDKASSAPAAAEPETPAAAPAETAASAPAATAAAPTPAGAGSSKVTTKNEPAWAACHGSAKLKGKDVSKNVAALSKACAKATKMKLVGKTLTGKQSDSGSPQSYPLKAGAKHCYRVYAAGGDGIKDLDVAIKDSAGNVVGEDATDAATAVVLSDGAVCFKEADAASVVVSVGSGGGAYAVQIWGD